MQTAEVSMQLLADTSQRLVENHFANRCHCCSMYLCLNRQRPSVQNQFNLEKAKRTHGQRFVQVVSNKYALSCA